MSKTPGNLGNTGNLVEFFISPGNAGSLMEFNWLTDETTTKASSQKLAPIQLFERW